MPSQLMLFLPIIAAGISYLLQQEHWPPSIPIWMHTWINGSVALLTIVGSVGVDLLFQGKLTGSITGDILLIGGATAALQVETYRPLQQYIREIGFSSPSGTIAIPAPLIAKEPSGIVLPANNGDYGLDTPVTPTPRDPTTPMPVVPPTIPDSK